MIKNKIVAIYARADDEFALTKEINELKKICKKKNYKIHEIYTELGVSGSTLENRYYLQKMMKDLKERKFETIMVYEASVITRNVTIYWNFLKEIKKYDCNLEFSTESEEIINNFIKRNGKNKLDMF